MATRRARATGLQGGARVLGVLRRNRASLLLGTALQATALLVVALPADAQPSPNARPMGGSVVAGAASISTPNATTTAINQSSQRAAINWQSFDVGSQQSVNFNQPSASAITLNRVTGPDPSAIAGQIHANGQLVLTNPSGVVFYRGAQVNAQALVVSAPGITTQNFMAGKMVFDQPAKPGALVSNAGTITVKQAGLAGLVAPQVANSGTINARMGHVVLAGAEAHTVDLYGDGLMSIDVTKQVTQAPIGPDGKPVAALVTNTGLIRADGGTVQLTAAAADGIVQNLVDAGGRIQANSVGSKTGTVTIAGTGGSVTVSGQVLATGTAPGTTGGQIEVNATGTANVASTARINASGRAGGGTVALGTTLARAIGGPSVTPTMTAARTVVQHGARIAASAGGRGNGGQVTLLSSGLTNFSGRITAHGGATGGNGGNVEISGAGVSLHGSVDVTAPHGAMGNITLDPANLTITNSGANNGELTDNQDPNLAYNTPNTTTDASVTPAALAGLHGNVHLQATDNLYVASSLTLTTAGESLRLEAGDNLTVEPNVTISTAGNINLSAATATIPGFNAAGGLSLVRGATVTTSNGSVTLSAGSAAAGSIGIRIDNSSVIASSGQTIALNADNIDVYGSALALRAPNGVIAIAPTTAGRPVELLNLGTFVAGALGVSQYEVGLMSAATLRLGSSTAGPISIGSGTGDHVILNGIGSLAGGVGTLDLESGAGVTEPGSFAVNTLIGNAQSAVSLGSISNTIAILGGFGAPAGFTLGNTGDIDITGAVNGGTGIAIQTQANGTLSAGAITIGAPLSATSVGLIGAGISETGIGVITAGTLTGSGTGISLGGANSIGDLGALSSTGSLLLDNISPLSVTGSVHATGLLSVTETGALTLANGGVFNAASVAVASSGAFTETGNGAVIATALSGSASAVSLNGSGNQVGSLAGFTTTSGNFSLTDSTRLNVTAPVSVASGQTLSLFTDGLTIGPLGGSLTAAGSLSAPGGTIQLAPFTANTPVLVYNIGSAASTGLSIPAGELSSMSASTLQLGSATTSGVTIGNAGDLITIAGSIAPTLAVLTNATGTVTEGGPLTVGTLTGTAGSLVFDYLNQIGTLGSFTTNTGLALTNGTGLTVTGPLNDGQGITLLVNNGDLTLAGNLTAPTIGLYAVIGSVTNAGNIVQTAGLISASNALYLNAASGNVTQSGGSITATTLSVPTAAGVSLNSATNSIVNLGSVTVDPGAFSLVDGRALNATGNVYVTGNATLNVAGNLSLRAFLVSNATLDLIATGGAISEPNYGYVVARQLTGQAASASLTRANNIGTLGSFLTNTGFTLTNRTGLSVTGPVTDTNTGVTLTSSGSLNLSGSITAPSIALTANTYQGDFTVPGNITQTAGVLNGRTLVALNAGGSIAQTGGSITSALLEANAPTGVSLVGPANLVTDLGSSSSAGGFAFANAESLTVVGPVRDPPGVTLSATGDLTISNAVSGPTVSLTATGAITETSTGSVSATTLLTGSSGAATTLGQIANSVANLGSFTAGTDFLLTDSVPLSVSGTVSAGSGRTLELDDNAPTLATGSLLSAPGGLVVIAPATANTAVALGSASGIGTRPAVNAATLRIGSTTAGSISIAGSFDLVGAATLDLESAAAINEIAAGSASALGMIVANTLIGNGLSASLGGANSITTLGSFHTANGFSLSNAQSLTVAGPVIDTNTGVTISVNPGSLTLAGNITAPSVLARSTTGPLTQQSGTLTGTLSVGLYGGAVTQSGGAIITNTLRSTGSTITLGGATNSVASVGLLEATSGNVTFDDSTGFAIAGTIGPLGSASAPGTIGLFTGGAITESTGGEIIAALLTGQAGSATLNQTNAVQSVGSFTSNGGFLLDDGTDVTLAGPLHDNTSIAVTTSGNIDVTGSVAAPGISLTSNIGVEFPVGGTIVLAGTLAGGAVSLLGEKSIVQTGGVISATTLTGGSTFYGTSLTSPTNTIGSLGSFSSNGGFSLVDTAPLAIIGNVSDPTSVSLVSQSAITQTAGSITTALLTGSGAGVQLIQPGNSITSLGSFASSGNFALTDGAPITVSGSVTVGTGDTLTLADNAPSFAAAGSLIAAGGTVVLAPATAGDALTLGGPGGFAAGSAVSANTLQIGAANAGSITITGALDLIGASTLDLVSSSTIAETGAGAVAAPVLIGSGTAATLTGANSITSLGSFHTANGFALTNAQSLTVAGPVTDTNTGVTISVNPGGLTLAGSIGGPIIDLIAGAGGIAQTGGSVSAGNTISLRSTGSISQSGGGLIANALNVYQTGGAGVSLTATGNTIANLGSVTTTPGNFALVDQSGLNVAGPVVVAPGNVTLNAAGSLSINGFLSGDGVDLIAGDITAPAGSVHATTLTGDARSLNFSGSAVYVGTIGSFTTTNGFTLADRPSGLTVSGPVIDNVGITLTSHGTMTVSGTVDAPNVSLNAVAYQGTFGASPGVISQTGGLIDGATGVALSASGSIAQTGGSLVAGVLSGNSGGTTSLPEATNAIAALGSFVSTGAITLADGEGLAITGAVSAPALGVSIGGALTEPSGSLSVTTLAGSASSTSLGQIANSIANLGSFSTSGDFSLTDGAPLSIAGSVVVGTGHTLTLADNAPSFAAGGSLIAAGGTVVLTPATPGNALTLGGGTGFGAGSAVSANTLQIGSSTAGSITITGALDLAGASTLDLVSNATIAETGVGAVEAPTLTGNGLSATLTGANSITTLGSFYTTNGFSLTNSQNLTVGGPVNGGTGVTLSVTNANLTLAGNISATNVGLYATGASATNTGNIAQSGGSLTATFLTASGDNGVDLTGSANSIGFLNSSMSANGPFALADRTGLVINGYVYAATQLTLRAGGPITEGSLGGVGALTLTGSATSLALTAADNYIGTLGNFVTTNGLTLKNAKELTVAGSITDNVGITLASLGTLAVSGTLEAPDVSLTARNLTRTEGVETVDSTQVRALAAGTYVVAPGVITQSAGSIGATTLLTLIADSSIAQTGGSITAGTLTGSSGATTSLPDATNAIAALGSFTSVGAFTLADGTALAITGPVSAPSLGVSIGGALTESSGTLHVTTLTGSASTTSLGQIGNSIANLGSFSSTGDFYLTDGAPLSVAGSVVVGTGHTLTLADDNPSFAAGGSLIAAGGTVVLTPATAFDPLTLGGGSGFGAGSAVTANTLQIGSSTAGAISITGALDLTGANTLDLVSGAAIAETGSGAIAAPTLIGSGTSANLGGINAIGTLGSFHTSNGFSLTDPQSLTIAGPVTDANTGVSVTAGSLTLAGSIGGPAVTLIARAGGISQQSGSIGASLLTGSASSAATFAGPNSIATLGSFTTPSGLLLTDAAPLAVAGPVSAGSVTLNDAAGITFTGTVGSATGSTGTLSVNTAQSVVQTGGTISAVLLTGTAGTLAQFGPDAPGPVANIGTLGSFTVGNGRLGLTDAAPLTVAGPVSASSLVLAAPGTIALAGGTISTAGAPLSQQLGADPAPTGSSITVLPGNNGSGQLVQTGTTTLTSLANGVATIRLQAPPAGSISFNDLMAPTTNVVLASSGGTISGLVDVASLTVLGQTGSARLTGTVNGIGGTAAAPISAIRPTVDPAYTINGCVIATTCGPVLIPPQITLFTSVFPTLEIPGLIRPIDLFGDEAAALAEANQFLLLGGLITFVPPRDLEDPDVMLPNISDRDY